MALAFALAGREVALADIVFEADLSNLLELMGRKRGDRMARERKNPHTKSSMINLVQAQLFGVNIDESHINMTDSDVQKIFVEAFRSRKNKKFNNDSILNSRKKLIRLCKKISKYNKNASNLLSILQDKDINIYLEMGPGVREFFTHGAVESESDDKISKFAPGCVVFCFAIFLIYIIIEAITFEDPLTGPQIYCQRQGTTC